MLSLLLIFLFLSSSQSHPSANDNRSKLSEYAKATLGSGNMRSAVVLPKGEEMNEWLAVNTVDFFNEISLLYGTVTEFCTSQSCPVMSASPQFEYLWCDNQKVKKPIQCSAPEYVDYLMSWVESQCNKEKMRGRDVIVRRGKTEERGI